MTDKALLIGINAYPGCPLNGCVNDISDMADYLTTKCGFQRASIRLLVDGRATTQAILERLQWLVGGAVAGDRLFFHYSGHGTLFPKRDSTGAIVALQSAICPVDFDWTDEHAIVADQFHQIFSSIPAGVQFIWLSDSCHSADLEEDKPLPTSMDPDTVAALSRGARAYPMPLDIKWRLSTAREIGITPPSIPSSLNAALISGCKSDQTSADAYINGRYNGACTYYLLQELNKVGSTVPLTQVVSDLDVSIKAANYEQIPGLEGSSDITSKPFFSA